MASSASSPSPTDTVYIVTGANRGIGLGLVKALLARLHTTVVATSMATRPLPACETNHPFRPLRRPKRAGRAHVAVLDLSTVPTPEQFLEALPTAAVPRVDVLVANEVGAVRDGRGMRHGHAGGHRWGHAGECVGPVC
ncbi:hypothetical protein PG995_005204 [Apiospora arundinis]